MYEYVYIAYRDVYKYLNDSGKFGGNPVNTDFRLTTLACGRYLLTCELSNYAVADDAAEKFISDVLEKCGEKHRGFYPEVPPQDTRDSVAVVEIQESGKNFYYDMDAEVLHKMLEDLKTGSGVQLDQRGLINYSYPNPELPEDFVLNSITHQIYHGPDNTPVSVIKAYEPDKRTSRFQISGDDITVSIRDGDDTKTYDVPADLIPDIRDKVKELCKEPAEAYVDAGDWESFIRFGKKDERIFTDPDKTKALLDYIASRSTLRMLPVTEVKNNPPVIPVDTSRCHICGAPRYSETSKFCTECGVEFK